MSLQGHSQVSLKDCGNLRKFLSLVESKSFSLQHRQGEFKELQVD